MLLSRAFLFFFSAASFFVLFCRFFAILLYSRPFV